MGANGRTFKQHGKLPGTLYIRTCNRKVGQQVACHLFSMTWSGNNAELIEWHIVKLVKELANNKIIIRNNSFNCRYHIPFANIDSKVFQCILQKGRSCHKKKNIGVFNNFIDVGLEINSRPVSYTHLRAHETRHDLVCRLLLEN